ncbi:MAG: hypothetical protein JNL10_09745, partial [Verrucomicrobiales bacterium]|nr:hypothetical protein [Verrucomicrobiales bacterium]
MRTWRFRDHDPEFLKRLRRGARDRLARRNLRPRRPHWNRERYFDGEALWMLLLSGLWAAGLASGNLGGVSLSPTAVSAAYAIAGLFLVTTAERSLHGRLFHGPDLATLVRLPASGAWMVRRQWARALRRIVFIAAAAFLGALIRLLFSDWTWWRLPEALLFAMVFAAMVLAAITWLSGTGRGVWLSGISWTVLITTWIGSKFLPGLAPWVAGILNQYGGLIVALLPTGWVIDPFHRAIEGDAGRDWLFLIPAAVLTASIPAALHWLTGRVQLREHTELRYASQVPDDADDDLRAAVHDALLRPPERPLGQLRDAVLSRSFLQSEPTPPQAGWIERWISRSWNARERLLSDLAYGILPPWTRTYLNCLALLLGCVGAAVAGRYWRIEWLECGWFAALALILIGIAPVAPAAHRLGYQWESSQGMLPLCSVMPVGLPEIGRWCLRTGRGRLLIGAPVILAFGMAVGWVRPDVVSWQQGAFGSLGIWISLFGLQPLWLVETLLN